ncbi:unnamed protein product [Anisakis simplex]|uniref:UDENN domain-containing protein n=1 Tax=Anisakis simplex TaxID=6269 RepID=A0A0M3JB63_ANISI|nr:unnamed protein product [Anisakis simplex]
MAETSIIFQMNTYVSFRDHQSNAAYYLEQDPVHVKLYGGQRPQYPYHGQRSDWLKECLDNESGSLNRLLIAEAANSTNFLCAIILCVSTSNNDTQVSVSRDTNFRRQTFCEGAAASGSRRSSHTSEPCDEIANEITSSSDVLCDDPRDNERLKQQFDVTSSMINQRQESTDESSSIVSTSQQRSSDDSNDSPSDESSSSGISHGIIIDAARQTSLECQSASTETSKSPSPAHQVSGGLGGVGSSQTHPPSGSEQASTSAANRNSDSSSPYYKLNRCAHHS